MPRFLPLELRVFRGRGARGKWGRVVTVPFRRLQSRVATALIAPLRAFLYRDNNLPVNRETLPVLL